MSDFYDMILNPVATKKVNRNDPFQDLVPRRGGPKVIHKFQCDSTNITSLKPLGMKYLSLSDITHSTKMNRNYTIACVCESKNGTYLISNLRNKKILLDAKCDTQYTKGDVIGIALPEYDLESGKLSVSSDKQLVLIGKIKGIEKCKNFEVHDPDCSLYVYPDQILCDHHTNESFYNVARNDPLVRTNSSPSTIQSPYSSPSRENIYLNQTVLPPISSRFLDSYTKSHPIGRGTKFSQSLKKSHDKPRIGQGLKSGDVIILKGKRM